MTSDKPLIFTSKGNLPAADLAHSVEWQVSPEQIVFIETYKLGDEVVKQSSHVKLLIGAAAVGEVSL
jgi:hypothetical protein